ncbi:GNAT family N-acetyltransferase [Flavobacterium sp.]|uniref:GNAT family N-acetyltransferase n=1 Tax=Flavobacterium sp. TaxID=239 RepID=UPI00260F31B8|nr:GNAT family N-acetyltransferase [Flavobacterium sp.]
MEKIMIREITLQDMEVWQALAKETFFETFSENNSAENMAQYLENSFNIPRLTAELSNPDSQFFMAWDGTTAVGYLKLNSGNAQTELQDDTALEIERIYVKSSYHGQKVGQLLYEKALEIAQKERKKYVWLAVWEENYRAIRFYTKNGFVAFDKHIFRLGNDEQTDIMMKKVLE